MQPVVILDLVQSIQSLVRAALTSEHVHHLSYPGGTVVSERRENVALGPPLSISQRMFSKMVGKLQVSLSSEEIWRVVRLEVVGDSIDAKFPFTIVPIRIVPDMHFLLAKGAQIATPTRVQLVALQLLLKILEVGSRLVHLSPLPLVHWLVHVA